MMVVLDPSRVFVGKPESFGGYGDYLATMCERYGAVGGINGGAYYDARTPQSSIPVRTPVPRSASAPTARC